MRDAAALAVLQSERYSIWARLFRAALTGATAGADNSNAAAAFAESVADAGYAILHKRFPRDVPPAPSERGAG